MGAQRITNCLREIPLFQKGDKGEFWLEKPIASMNVTAGSSFQSREKISLGAGTLE
jgi:hypothetical protein